MLGITVTFQAKTEGEKLGLKNTCWTMAAEWRRGQGELIHWGLMHAIGRRSLHVHCVCHKGISIKLKPA